MAGALAMAFALSACAPEVQMPVPTPEYTSTYEPPPPTALAPLTGETVALDSLTAPSIAAKIDNHPAARPQVGLERADLVFEELVEGGLSRYVAVWHSDVPDEIGPVRSIRPMDPDIISPLGGIVAYSGGQYQYVQAMKDTPVYNAIHGQPDTRDTFYRTDLKRSPHDVIVKAPVVISQHLDLAAPVQQFAFSLDVASSTAAKEGSLTSSMDLVLGGSAKPSWVWDEARGQWLRFMTGGDPDTDFAGAQLGTVNVVVLRVDVTYAKVIPKTELLGSGEAWVSTGGRTVHGTWSKSSPVSPIHLVDDNGVTIRLAPGNTWIELVPTNRVGSVTFNAPPTT